MTRQVTFHCKVGCDVISAKQFVRIDPITKDLIGCENEATPGAMGVSLEMGLRGDIIEIAASGTVEVSSEYCSPELMQLSERIKSIGELLDRP